jgi:hypothetical protein
MFDRYLQQMEYRDDEKIAETVLGDHSSGSLGYHRGFNDLPAILRSILVLAYRLEEGLRSSH